MHVLAVPTSSPRSPFTLEPWWDVYLPALWGERALVREALSSLEDDADARDPTARGAAFAVAARALLVLRCPAEAWRFAERAFAAGGAEADALATFLLPDGLARAHARIAAATRPGARADASCDLAVLHLRAGRLEEARAAVGVALAACPLHTEGARWQRFLAGPDPVASMQAAEACRGRRAAGRAAGVLDALELFPGPRDGWVSAERLRRRVMLPPPALLRIPMRSALQTLSEAGVGETQFALPEEYGALLGDHPLVGLEWAADQLRARVREGHDAREAARQLWSQARSFDAVAAADAAHLIAALGTHDPALSPLAHGVATWALQLEPEDQDLWRAYRAFHGAVSGRPDAAADARSVLADPGCPAQVWLLAVAALRALGDDVSVTAATQAAARRADLLAARVAARSRGPFLPRLTVPPRLRPRAAEASN